MSRKQFNRLQNASPEKDPGSDLIVTLVNGYFASAEQLRKTLNFWEKELRDLICVNQIGKRESSGKAKQGCVTVEFLTSELISVSIVSERLRTGIAKARNLYNTTSAVTNLEKVVEYIITRDCVHWVELRIGFLPQNRFVTKLVQSNDPNASRKPSTSRSNILISNRVVWDHGLRGEGEVVAIGDTGLDLDSCFFHDFSCLRANGDEKSGQEGSTGFTIHEKKRKQIHTQYT